MTPRDAARGTTTPTRLLARTFFGRFFESDLLPPDVPQAQFVVWSLAFLAMPGLLLPIKLIGSLLQTQGPEALTRALLLHRLIFIALSMTVAGVVALIVWDGVFPDRRDARILTPLPVSGRVLIGARLLALAALCCIFIIGVNAVPTLTYGLAAGAFGGATNPLRGLVAHFVSTTMAAVFVFTALLALQGLALNVGGSRAADRLSFLAQILFVLALLQVAFFMPMVAGALPSDLRAGWVLALPSAWFLGLNEMIGGRPAAGAPVLAATALAATAVSTSAAVALFVLTHARLTRLALESREIAARTRLRVTISTVATRALCRTPVARAVFELVLRTLARSRSHRLLMSAYVGVAGAVIASGIVPLIIRRGVAALGAPNLEMLAGPLLLSFFTLIGMRIAVAIPTEPRARWAVRMAEPRDRVAAIKGVRAALLLIGVGPSLVLAAVNGIMWGSLSMLATHVYVSAAMGILLVSILLLSLAKIPFTSTYYPGTSRFGVAWPLYLTGFITYAFAPARIQLALQRNPSTAAVVVFSVMTIGVALALGLWRNYKLRAQVGLTFEEEDPSSMFQGFSLSEGMAAAPESRLH